MKTANNNFINLLFFTFIIFLFSCSEKTKNIEKKTIEVKIFTEKDYLRQRDSFIEKLNKQPINYGDTSLTNTETKFLSKLDSILRSIIIDTRITEFKNCGSINLQTLFRELGFGMLDGLFCDKKEYKVIVTTEYLFNEYFKGNKLSSPKQIIESDLSSIFTSSFESDAFVTNFSNIPINSEENSVISSAFIGSITQDIGPILPNTIFVIVFKNKKVYLFEKSLNREIIEIPKCRQLWDSLQMEKNVFYEEIQKTGDEGDFEKLQNMGDTAWKNYCDCYKENLKYQQEYSDLIVDASKLVKLIEN